MSENPTPRGEAEGMCPACPHPVATHDAVATRFCAATSTTAVNAERRCLCSAQPTDTTNYSNTTRAPMRGGA